MPKREGPLSWEDVRILREADLHELADIAEKYVRIYEKRKNRWWRRLYRAML